MVRAQATAKLAMMDRMGDSSKPPEPMPPLDKATADMRSLTRMYAGGGGGGNGGTGAGAATAAPRPPPPPGGGGGAQAKATTNAASTAAELLRLQRLLVRQLQEEYFCDDVEPPELAFGWSESKLRDYFENGGE